MVFRIATVWRHCCPESPQRHHFEQLYFWNLLPRSKVTSGSEGPSGESQRPLLAPCAFAGSEKENPRLRVRWSLRCCVSDTESQSRRKPASSGLVAWMPLRGWKPAWLLCDPDLGVGGEMCLHPWSVLATHTPPQSKDIGPTEQRSCECSPRVCFLYVSQGQSLEREKIPFAQPQR